MKHNYAFEVTDKDITSLGDVELTQLLSRLLYLEADKMGLAKRYVEVGLKITVPDGGQDGRLEWLGAPEPTISDWIPSRLNVFQVKATAMNPEKCKNELLIKGKGKSKLKPALLDLVDKGGSYILFYGRNCAGRMISERREKIKEVFQRLAGSDEAERIQVEVYGAEKIAEWTNQYVGAIAFVLRTCGRGLPAAFQTWDQWAQTISVNLKFFADDSRQDITKKIRSAGAVPGQVVRIGALSGLGKTRLAFESFRRPADKLEDIVQNALCNACVYVRDGEVHKADLINALHSWNGRVRACLIVDECSVELHRLLEEIVGNPESTISLLTLDFDPGSDPHTTRCTFLRLDVLSLVDMEALVIGSSPEMLPHQISAISEMAQGFPLMADLLITEIARDEPNLWNLAHETVYRRLVVRRSHSADNVWEVAKALSIVEHVGIEKNVAYQFGILCKELSTVHDETSAFSALQELRQAGVVYGRGDYIRIRPLPLAVTLAREWWSQCQPARATDLLTGSTIPPEIVDSMTLQLRRLKGDPWVEKLVAGLFEAHAPFRSRDLLDSARGSRVTSSLAEVNPRAVCEALTSVFGLMDSSGARIVVAGRRGLVECCEKLAWWPATFHDAAWLMLLFAAGENETWGNNATNLLHQFLHVFLSGTEVPAIERLSVTKRGINSTDPAVRLASVLALTHSFSARFMRSGLVDRQGSGLPRTDWVPRSQDEVKEYWLRVVDLLSPFLACSDEVGRLTRAEFARHTSDVLSEGRLDILEAAFEVVRRAGIVEWPELLDNVRRILLHPLGAYTAETRSKLETIVAALIPITIDSRLTSIVSNPTWSELRTEKDGSITVVAQERAQQLAAELASKPDELLHRLHLVLEGEQRQGFTFGQALGRHLSSPRQFLQDAVGILGILPIDRRNPAVLMGLADTISQSDEIWLRNYLHGLLNIEDMKVQATHIIRGAGPDDADVVKLAEMVASGALSPESVNDFAFGGALGKVSDVAVATLAGACTIRGLDGAVVSLHLLGMRCPSRNSGDAPKIIAKDLGPQVQSVLVHPGLLERIGAGDGLTSHLYEELAKSIIRQTQDVKFVELLFNQAIELAATENRTNDAVKTVIQELLKVHPDVVWPLFQEQFVGDNKLRKFRIQMMFSPAFDSGLNITDIVDANRLLSWCGHDETIGLLLARLLKPLRKPEPTEPHPSWNPIAIELISRFGQSDAVLSAIYGNIIGGVWIGSKIPKLTAQRTAFLELSDHPTREVAGWVARVIESIDQNIADEQKRLEEESEGFYR